MPGQNYTRSEIHTMQEDAIRRVMEMQRIANERLQRSNAARGVRTEDQRSEPEQNNSRDHEIHNYENQKFSQPKGRAEGETRGGHEGRSHPSPVHHTMPVEISEPQSRQMQTPASFLSSGSLEGFVKRLGLESDQLILIGLLLLLINVGADTVLILAVFYLLI